MDRDNGNSSEQELSGLFEQGLKSLLESRSGGSPTPFSQESEKIAGFEEALVAEQEEVQAADSADASTKTPVEPFEPVNFSLVPDRRDDSEEGEREEEGEAQEQAAADIQEVEEEGPLDGDLRWIEESFDSGSLPVSLLASPLCSHFKKLSFEEVSDRHIRTLVLLSRRIIEALEQQQEVELVQAIRAELDQLSPSVEVEETSEEKVLHAEEQPESTEEPRRLKTLPPLRMPELRMVHGAGAAALLLFGAVVLYVVLPASPDAVSKLTLSLRPTEHQMVALPTLNRRSVPHIQALWYQTSEGSLPKSAGATAEPQPAAQAAPASVSTTAAAKAVVDTSGPLEPYDFPSAENQFLKKFSSPEFVREVGVDMVRAPKRALPIERYETVVTTYVYPRPHFQAPAMAKLHKGTRLNVVSLDEDWARVVSKRGEDGFVMAQDIVPLS